jgi:hypothetical protein
MVSSQLTLPSAYPVLAALPPADKERQCLPKV